MTKGKLEFFHAPNTRSSGVLYLLEALGSDYQLRLINMPAGAQREPEYLAVNPMGKVPAIVDNGQLVTEQSAVYQYLAERFPKAGLAPEVGSSGRGSFLRWLAFYGSSFEPAVVDKATDRPPVAAGTSPYGDFETTLAVVQKQLQENDFICGSNLTAADFLWGAALSWITGFGMVEATSAIQGYVDRFNLLPAVISGRTRDAQYAAELESE